MSVVLGALALQAAAADDHTISGVVVYNGAYVPERWVPLRIRAENTSNVQADGQGIIGDQTAPIRSESGAKLFYTLPLTAPPRSRAVQLGYACFPDMQRDESQVAATVANLAWRDRSGAEIARYGLVANPYQRIILTLGDRNAATGVSVYSTYEVIRLLNAAAQTRMASIDLTADSLPDNPIGYDSVTTVVLDGFDPQSMTLSQRHALLAWLLRGGTLIIPAPEAGQRLSTSWLADYLPVQIVGSRQLSIIPRQTASSDLIHIDSDIHFRKPVTICEAVPANAGEQVFLRDDQYVHAAFRAVGMGRIVFTSFPISAIAETVLLNDGSTRIGTARREQRKVPDPRNPSREVDQWFWIVTDASGVKSAVREGDARGLDPFPADFLRQLLLPPPPTRDWQSTALATPADVKPSPDSPAPQDEIMLSMIGIAAPRWTFAAAVAGGFLAVVLLLQFLLRGARRPGAYAIITVIAVVVASSVIIAQRYTRRGLQLTGGQLAIIDAGPNGGGRVQQAVGIFGRQVSGFRIITESGESSIKPMLASKNDPIAVQIDPVAAVELRISEDRPDRLWLIDGPMAPTARVSANLHFDDKGAQLAVDNGLFDRIALNAALLIYGRESFRLGDLPAGESRTALSSPNEPDRFIASDVLNDQTLLRETFIKSLMAPLPGLNLDRQAPPELQLIAWSDWLPDLFHTSTPMQRPMRRQTMLRAPVRIAPSPVGSRIRIPGALVSLIDSGRDTAFEQIRSGEELPDGDWLLGFAPPSEIGRLKPTRVTVRLDLQAQLHSIELRTKSDRSLAQWSTPIGAHTVEIVPDPADLDANGWLWLRMIAKAEQKGVGGVQPKWRLRRILVDHECEVVGPPFVPHLPKRQMAMSSEPDQPATPVPTKGGGKTKGDSTAPKGKAKNPKK